ncbi:MAG: phasin family protein [Wenzhouxiangella sp.]
MSKNTVFEELKKAQNVLTDTINKSAQTNLETFEKLMEINRKSVSKADEASNPNDLITRQSAVFKEYAEQLGSHVETLTNIGLETREQLTEISSEFAKGLDFSAMFPISDAAVDASARTAKSTTGNKSSKSN